ncbi:hypothetical protein KK062_17985 [Fulvivirgaceae bacterium PWU5]|uniref:Uncharacterized protein n=1 Tax=Dawidia cretensis TaxID=2782350 RepID=A0AAP2GW51_9BACT|nr:hypothetical protein [Dawidia cretensis]
MKGSVLLLAALACVSFTVVLHHGWANYDQTKTLNFKGEILESSYENPHGMLKLKVDDKVWTVVLAPPSRMEARGLKSDALAKGTSATVVGYPHKKVKDEMRAERITISDKTTELR